MTRQVLLNNIDHAELKVMPRFGTEHGDAVNQLPVFPTEFEALQREFPILFRRDEEGALQAVVLLGLDRSENLFLGSDGWLSRSVPAIQRRGPFSISVAQRGDDPDAAREPMIHVDLDDPRVGGSEGHRLFLPHGGNSPYLAEIVEVLRTIYEGLEASGPMYAAWEALGLVQPVAIEIAVEEGRSYNLPDYQAVSAEALASLGGTALDSLHRAGFLAPAIFALSSLGNVPHLIERKNRKDAQR
ncbi:SapC family protein [Sphingosinicella sp. BN140058]|uniref:SapC family protein n=1 Tax=Sphingosinicella sp. BN140058 TaxID=1892855 RepID=UPI0010134BD5|nr:SapC family protein [Sphingosinicella sp. BN140058]QAY76265.1 peptide ABC transporter permease [Sphingosinicella sp. BN140058]